MHNPSVSASQVLRCHVFTTALFALRLLVTVSSFLKTMERSESTLTGMPSTPGNPGTPVGP